MENSLVIVKPDAVRRGLIGEIISRLENRGYEIVEMKSGEVTEALANRHYEEHIGKPFFQELVDFITSGRVVLMHVRGANAIKGIRNTVGATNPAEAAAGTIRGDYANDIASNLVHASDSVESGKREIGIFFSN